MADISLWYPRVSRAASEIQSCSGEATLVIERSHHSSVFVCCSMVDKKARMTFPKKRTFKADHSAAQDYTRMTYLSITFSRSISAVLVNARSS